MFRLSSGKVVFAATGLMLCTLVRAGPTTRPDSAAAARQAQEYYRNVERAYMEGRWKELSAALRVSGRYNARLTRQQRANLAYIRRTAAEFRPPWWQATKSTSNRSFRAQIWKRWFVANYVPSELMGLQAPVGARDGKLVVIVSWRPSLVDNPRPLGGVLAKRLGLRKGDLGEVVVWHELGHNYVNNFLPIRHVMALYRHHSLLYRTLQEFYADLTAVYHSSPHARRAALLLRLDEIESNRESEPHTRAALGVGSLLLSEFLAAPQKWPSLHFPPKVPDTDAERNTILYVYRTMDKSWTLAEDRALREIVRKFIVAQGTLVLRRRGQVTLPNGLKFELMEPRDRQDKPQRDQWVRRRLEAIIKSGRADKKAPACVSARATIQLPW